MKAKLRTIQIDDETFLWRVVRLTQASICLRVWIAGKKASPWVEVICRFDDPWLSFGESASRDLAKSAESVQFVPLRPRQIAEIIRKVDERYRTAGHGVIHRVYELAGDGSLSEIAGASQDEVGSKQAAREAR